LNNYLAGLINEAVIGKGPLAGNNQLVFMVGKFQGSLLDDYLNIQNQASPFQSEYIMYITILKNVFVLTPLPSDIANYVMPTFPPPVIFFK
jgi:hypothetical protein